MVYAAIDPGISGGISILDGEKVKSYSVPSRTITKHGKSKNDFDIEAMANLFRPYVGKEILVLQEATHAMPNNGSVSMYFFGRGAGIWEGVLTALQIKFVQVPPQTWKKKYPDLLAEKIKVPKGATKEEKKELNNKKRLAKSAVKQKAREAAQAMFPEIASEFKRVKDDGKAESLLMAVYLRDNASSYLTEVTEDKRLK